MAESADEVVDVGTEEVGTIRGFASEILVEPDDTNGLQHRSAAQCQQVRAVSTLRVDQVRGIHGPAVLSQIRDVVGLILVIPT